MRENIFSSGNKIYSFNGRSIYLLSHKLSLTDGRNTGFTYSKSHTEMWKVSLLADWQIAFIQKRIKERHFLLCLACFLKNFISDYKKSAIYIWTHIFSFQINFLWFFFAQWEICVCPVHTTSLHFCNPFVERTVKTERDWIPSYLNTPSVHHFKTDYVVLPLQYILVQILCDGYETVFESI